jgi:hypothetical protein
MPVSRVYDCFMYNGEADILDVRLHELDSIVDVFVIVEALTTHAGEPKSLQFQKQDPRFSKFESKIRHVVIREWPSEYSFEPWPQNSPAYFRENWQRDSIMQGLSDSAPDDLVLISDADEIPRRDVIRRARDDTAHDAFGFRLELYYFAFNFRNVGGPETMMAWSFAVRRRLLDTLRATELRRDIRANQEVGPSIKTLYYNDAGWHFSYLTDRTGVVQKMKASTHQELNTPQRLEKMDPEQCIADRRDVHGRPDFKWDLVSLKSLPARVLHNLPRFRRFIWLATPTGVQQMPQARAVLASTGYRALAALTGKPWR